MESETPPAAARRIAHLAFFPSTPTFPQVIRSNRKKERMSDWGPVVIAVVLFVLLSPGLLFQLPGHCSFVEFGNLHTSAASIVVHSIIFFALITVFVIVVGVHITTGDQPAY
ncbi:hypothetical protein PVAP13_3NG177233 [Panicum virgatum]|uniref:Uncharacterized protein n=2 Tax=Panicum virgatum TaxID=38727 RepID=A0A8T0TXM0_PANVG|nr:hypothetical protein PVAP13_3NG177233 [Panicum virgatum]